MSDEIRAFKMQLKPGVVAEYKKRHDELWPDLAEALRGAGIHDYSIFLDESTLSLFAVLKLKPACRSPSCRRCPSCAAGGTTWPR